MCIDNNFHPFDPTQRLTSNYTCQSVKIGKNGFIVARFTVLRVVTIDNDTVITAGRVIVKDVPSGVIFAGNPSKFVSDLCA